MALDFAEIPFVTAKHFKKVSLDHPRRVQAIVIHTIESAELSVSAENCAHDFATTSTVKSAHYCIDNNSIVQCVQTKDIAFAAPPFNTNGIHLEHAGKANQSAAKWADAYSTAMLKRSAQLCGEILCPKFGIPARWLTDAEVENLLNDPSIKGFCTHNQVSMAFGQSDHSDPGPHFPFGSYIQWVADYL